METDVSGSLRLILLIIGVFIILAIYIMSLTPRMKSLDSSVLKRWLFLFRKSPLQGGRQDPDQRVAPQISDEDESGKGWSKAGAQPSRYLLVLYVQAMEGRPFSGPAIVHAAGRVGLQKAGDDDQGFFQYHPAGQNTMIHITNRLKPGLFTWREMDEFSTAGLSVFAELQAAEARSTLTAALDCAHRLADTLGGRLLDEDHQVLTTIKIREIQEAVQSFFAGRHADSGD